MSDPHSSSRAAPPGEREPQRFTVWRLDDNGNQFRVSTHASLAAAEAEVAAFEARGHKQSYWAE